MVHLLTLSKFVSTEHLIIMDSFKLVCHEYSTKNRQAGVLYKMVFFFLNDDSTVGKKYIGWTNELFCQEGNLDVLVLTIHPFWSFSFLLSEENIESKNLTFWVKFSLV